MRHWRFPLLMVVLILLILAMKPVRVTRRSPPQAYPKRPSPPPPVFAGLDLIPEIIELQKAEAPWVPDWYEEKMRQTEEAIRRADQDARSFSAGAMDNMHRFERAITNAVSYISGFVAGADSMGRVIDARAEDGR